MEFLVLFSGLGLAILMLSVASYIARKKRATPKDPAHVIRYDNHLRDIWADAEDSRMAEQAVTRQLTVLGHEYFIFQNIILPAARRELPYTEIDHVVVSRFGIFCIETKSQVGSIYGARKSHDWTQYIYKKSYPFYNPLKQNYAHVHALEKFLDDKVKSPVHHYVVFPRAKVVKVNDMFVTNDVADIVTHIQNHKRAVYTLQELEAILRQLAHYDSKHTEIEDEHIGSLKEYLEEQHN